MGVIKIFVLKWGSQFYWRWLFVNLGPPFQRKCQLLGMIDGHVKKTCHLRTIQEIFWPQLFWSVQNYRSTTLWTCQLVVKSGKLKNNLKKKIIILISDSVYQCTLCVLYQGGTQLWKCLGCSDSNLKLPYYKQCLSVRDSLPPPKKNNFCKFSRI